LKSVQVFLNEWEWITVLDSDLIQAAIVHTETKRSIRLFDEENPGSGRRGGGTNGPFG
jgi:hypothetical protein